MTIISHGVPIAGSILSTDPDSIIDGPGFPAHLYEFEAQTGDIVVVDPAQFNEVGNCDLGVYLINATDTVLDYAYTSGGVGYPLGTSPTSFIITATGTYRLEAVQWWLGAAAVPALNYSITLTHYRWSGVGVTKTADGLSNSGLANEGVAAIFGELSAGDGKLLFGGASGDAGAFYDDVFTAGNSRICVSDGFTTYASQTFASANVGWPKQISAYRSNGGNNWQVGISDGSAGYARTYNLYLDSGAIIDTEGSITNTFATTLNRVTFIMDSGLHVGLYDTAAATWLKNPDASTTWGSILVWWPQTNVRVIASDMIGGNQGILDLGDLYPGDVFEITGTLVGVDQAGFGAGASSYAQLI